MTHSPCTKVCKIKEGVCTGCHRTLEQIGAWGSMTNKERQEAMAKMEYTYSASADKQAHWSQGNPGLADQYRQEAFAAREALGFSCDSLEVSPADIRQAIADKQAASMPEGWEGGDV